MLKSWVGKRIIMGLVGISHAGSAQISSMAEPPVQVRLRQSKLADCAFSPPGTTSVGIAKMVTHSGGDVILSGVDQSGKTWSATYQASPGAGCELWQAQLEQDGASDLIFIQKEMNGTDTTLSLLLFDGQGRPFPWQPTGEFTVDASGVRELVELGENHKPVVLVPRRHIYATGDRRHSFSAYCFEGGRAAEFKGSGGGMVWPSSQGAANNSKQEQAQQDSLATVDRSNGHSNAGRGSSVFRGVSGSSDSDRKLMMSDSSVGLAALLVLDTSAGREIYSLPTLSDLAGLRPSHTTGVAVGIECSSGQCRPVTNWMQQ